SPRRRFADLARPFLAIALANAMWHVDAAEVSGPARTNPADRAATDEYVELSPFVVNEGKDNGYQAASTLAGTRLDTPLKDLGAAISIYTKDFLSDIGATSANDFLIYATGMEAAGPGGNYSGATDDIN